MTERAFYTVAEVARILAVSQGTVHRLIAGRELPAVKVSHGYRIRITDFEEYLERQRV